MHLVFVLPRSFILEIRWNKCELYGTKLAMNCHCIANRSAFVCSAWPIWKLSGQSKIAKKKNPKTLISTRDYLGLVGFNPSLNTIKHQLPLPKKTPFYKTTPPLAICGRSAFLPMVAGKHTRTFSGKKAISSHCFLPELGENRGCWREN